jgi:hypothetical protein
MTDHSKTTNDWANCSQWQNWLHHPVLGDPSWDTFRRIPGNPIGPDWDQVQDASFCYGVGCRGKIEGGRAKWNFQGEGFTLWSPKGPDLGDIEVCYDGQRSECRSVT